MLQAIAVLCTVALAWLYLTWRKVSGFWAQRGVPHEKPHPVYGSLTFLQKENPATFMKQLYMNFRTPYVGIWLFWRPALVINSPEIARNILIKDADTFKNRLLGSGISKTDPIGGLNLFTVNDPIWSSVRKRLTPVFTSAKLKALHELEVTKATELVQRIDNDLKQNKQSELRTMYADFTTDIIGTAAFGVKGDATLTGEGPMRAVTKEFMNFNYIRGLAWCSIFFLPEVVNFFRFSFFPKTATEYFRQVFKSVVNQRGDYNSESQNKDLLGALLKIKHDSEKNNENIHDDLLVSQAAIFLQAGFDTTAVALTYITYELAFHQEAQEKMYKELLDAKEKLGGKEFDGTVLSGLHYMNSVIKETLRKYAPMGWLDRVADQDYRIDEHLVIPAGTTVYVNGIGMQHDPELYPDPEAFIPERFLPENAKESTANTYLPFGDGPRNCIGMRFAYQTMSFALASIFLKYQVFPKPNSKKPCEVEIEKNGLFNNPGESLYVDFVPRT